MLNSLSGCFKTKLLTKKYGIQQTVWQYGGDKYILNFLFNNRRQFGSTRNSQPVQVLDLIMPEVHILTGSNGAEKSSVGPDYLPAHIKTQQNVFDEDKLFMQKRSEFWNSGMISFL